MKRWRLLDCNSVAKHLLPPVVVMCCWHSFQGRREGGKEERKKGRAGERKEGKEKGRRERRQEGGKGDRKEGKKKGGGKEEGKTKGSPPTLGLGGIPLGGGTVGPCSKNISISWILLPLGSDRKAKALFKSSMRGHERSSRKTLASYIQIVAFKEFWDYLESEIPKMML